MDEQLPNPLTSAKRSRAEQFYWDGLVRAAVRDAREAARIQSRMLLDSLKRTSRRSRAEK